MPAKKRSLTRRASVAVRHALLKRKKKRKLRRQITELKSKTDTSKMVRDMLLSGGKLFKELGEIPKRLEDDRLSEMLTDRRGRLQDMASDIGAQQSKQEIALKRKQKQLSALKKKKK